MLCIEFYFLFCRTSFRLESSSDHITIENLNPAERILINKFLKKEQDFMHLSLKSMSAISINFNKN